VFVALLAGSACSLALDYSDQIPCDVDSDCIYAAGMGTCEDDVCRPPGGASSDTEATTGDDDPTLTSDPTMTSADPTTSPDSSGSESGSETGPVGCTLHSDCSNDQRCSDEGVCTSLLSTECQILHWPNSGERDNVVFLGSIMPTSPPFDALIEDLQNAVQLGVEDFNEQTALQGDREVVWVGCDDSTGATAAAAAMEHLVGTVGVPAVIGPIFSEHVLAIADTAVTNEVFMITPTASAMSIAQLDDQDLVWRTIPGDVYQGNALVDRMIELDGGGGDVSNLLVLAKDDAYGNELLTQILPELETEFGMVNVVADTYPNPVGLTQEQILSMYGTVLAGVAADAPFSHVIFIGTSEIQVLLYSYLGQIWDPMMDPLPVFTVSHGAVPELERFINEIGATAATEPLVPLKPMIEDNLDGTSPVVLNPDNFDAFSLRYRIRFDGVEPLTAAALSYDATLATLFAACTVPADQPIGGAAIAAAMPRLVDGAGTDVSFSGEDISFISQARNALVVDGGSVDLQGVSGELQWDLETGDVRAGVWGWDIIDMTPDGSMPSALPTRLYTLNAEPATDGSWGPNN